MADDNKTGAAVRAGGVSPDSNSAVTLCTCMVVSNGQLAVNEQCPIHGYGLKPAAAVRAGGVSEDQKKEK